MPVKLIQFLISVIAVLIITHTGFIVEARAEPPPKWIAHVSSPGSDQPETGNSLFDQLFLKEKKGKKEYAIPFPFEALISDLENRVDNGKQPAVPHSLIPIGRSLQSEAAAPNYFQFPRSVITVVGEPVTVPGQGTAVINHRLFIAYQEKAQQLEVISYNEPGGRFEFQIVENYQSNTTPRVSQTSRALCMSCHQNGGPIFAASPWSETNFSPAVALKLMNARPTRFKSLTTTISNGAELIDLAISHANYLGVAQLIWQSGCEGNLDKLKNIRCRAAILQALLQYRLSGDIAFDTDSPEYRLDLVANLRDNWAVRWPGGLLLASAQIPDRDPFKPNLSDINHNPLSLRPAHAFWQKPDEALSKGIIYRIAGFLTRADIRRLDRHLLKLGNANNIETERYQAVCHIDINSSIRFPEAFNYACSNRSTSQSINATIEIEYHNNQISFLRVVGLNLLESSLIWQPNVSSIKILDTDSHRQLYAKMTGPSNRLSARLQNGNRISEMILSWPMHGTNSGPPKSLDMELIVSQDFKVLQEAIAQMVSESIAGRSQTLASHPFRQRAIINDLENYLGMETLKW